MRCGIKRDLLWHTFLAHTTCSMLNVFCIIRPFDFFSLLEKVTVFLVAPTESQKVAYAHTAASSAFNIKIVRQKLAQTETETLNRINSKEYSLKGFGEVLLLGMNKAIEITEQQSSYVLGCSKQAFAQVQQLWAQK